MVTPLQDNYRIYDFVARDSRRSPHGKIFYRNLDEPERYLPSANLLRDHFRQCVLRCVKGTGKVDKLRNSDACRSLESQVVVYDTGRVYQKLS